MTFYPGRQNFQELPYRQDTPLAVRLIRVTLPNGETELLATSLLDEEAYPREAFLHLYALHWQEEVRFDVLKE